MEQQKVDQKIDQQVDQQLDNNMESIKNSPYDKVIKGSNVSDMNTVRERLIKLLIDNNKQDVVEKINSEPDGQFVNQVAKNVSQQIELPETFYYSKPKTESKGKIMKIFPPSSVKKGGGNLLGLGSQLTGQVLLKDVELKFVNSSLYFNNEWKQYMDEPIENSLQSQEKEFQEYKMRSQLTILANLWNNTQIYQNEEVIKNCKALSIISWMLTQYAKKIVQTKDKKSKGGFIWSQDGQDKQGDDCLYTKLNAHMNLNPLSKMEFDKPVEIYQVKDQEQFELEFLNYRQMTINELSQYLRGKTVDLTVAIDSCIVTKNESINPKLRIHQIIVKKSNNNQQQYTQQHIGLDLSQIQLASST